MLLGQDQKYNVRLDLITVGRDDGDSAGHNEHHIRNTIDEHFLSVFDAVVFIDIYLCKIIL